MLLQSIALYLYLAGTFFMEAWLEVVVIELKNPALANYGDLDRQEHRRSAIYAAIIVLPYLAVFFFWGLYWLIPAVLILRRLSFDPALKWLRKRPWKRYEGTHPVDATMARIFGREGALREILAEVLVTVALFIIQFTNHLPHL